VIGTQKDDGDPQGFLQGRRRASCGQHVAEHHPVALHNSPSLIAIGRANIGPAETKLWNSPFSPHGSAVAGKSASSRSSSRRPTRPASICAGSTAVKCATIPLAIISRASRAVSRPHSGSSGSMPMPVSRASR
jgi:hypothetical protein